MSTLLIVTKLWLNGGTSSRGQTQVLLTSSLAFSSRNMLPSHSVQGCWPWLVLTHCSVNNLCLLSWTIKLRRRETFPCFFFSFSIFKKFKARENETNMKSIKSNHILGRVSRKTGIQRKEIVVYMNCRYHMEGKKNLNYLFSRGREKFRQVMRIYGPQGRPG